VYEHRSDLQTRHAGPRRPCQIGPGPAGYVPDTWSPSRPRNAAGGPL